LIDKDIAPAFSLVEQTGASAGRGRWSVTSSRSARQAQPLLAPQELLPHWTLVDKSPTPADKGISKPKGVNVDLLRVDGRRVPARRRSDGHSQTESGTDAPKFARRADHQPTSGNAADRIDG